MIKYLEIPKICPYCNTELIIKQENNSKILFCPNEQCESRLLNRIEHFFSKRNGINAKGLSKATIQKLIDWGWISEIKDVFELSKYTESWKNKTGFGEKSVMNILTSIRESTHCDLESVISAAGIPLIGRTVAKVISAKFPTYSAFKESIKGDYNFCEINGFGYEMNKSLKTFDYTELDYIVENYLTIENKTEEKKEQKLEGLTFCVTGKIKHWKNRDELFNFITSLGGNAVSAVSTKIDYLINNDINSASAKNKKAKELGKEIIDEETFIKIFDL